MADNILKLKVDSTEYDAKLKRASDGLTRYVEGCRKAGGTLEVVEKDTLAYVKALGNMETTSRTAKGKLAEMTKAFMDLSMQYRQLNAQEQASPFGRAMAQSLETLKGRINNYKAELNSVGSAIGETTQEHMNLRDVLGIVGDKLGMNSTLMTVVKTGSLGMTAAIGAGVTAIVTATKALSDYNMELARNKDVVVVTTGLKGNEAEDVSEKLAALSKVYGVDFRDAVNAANTLMQHFGKTGDEAVQLIREGLQGMINGDGPKLLTMIQQYAPAFKDAGISASQLVAIIHNSEGGIFTDDNMNAIVMGIKNIRLMRSSTSEALKKIGIDGDDMSKKLSNGTLTIFQAMQQVLAALSNTNASSQEAGEVMQAVFGKMGTKAGTDIAKAINTLNLNLEQTKTQTGGAGQDMDRLYVSTLRFHQALRDAFGISNFAAWKRAFQSKVLDALSEALYYAKQLHDMLPWNMQDSKGHEETEQRIKQGYKNIREGRAADDNGKPRPRRKAKRTVHYSTLSDGHKVYDGQTYGGYTYHYNSKTGRMVGTRATTHHASSGGSTTHISRGGAGTGRVRTGRVTTTPRVSTKAELSEEQLNSQKISALTEEYVKATDTRRAAIKQEIADLQKRNNEIKKLKDEAQGKVTPKVDYSQLTGENLSKMISDLNKQINQSEIGGTLYNKLTEKLKDANTFKGLLEEALKDGVELADFKKAGFWEKLLNSEDIPDDAWDKIVNIINEKRKALGKDDVYIDKESGDVKENKNTKEKDGGTLKNIYDASQKVVGGLSAVSGGLQQMGVKIPDGITKALGFMSGLMQTIQGVMTILSAFNIPSINANTAAVTANTGALLADAGSNVAQSVGQGISTVGMLAMLHHGGVVRAAMGVVVPGNNPSGDMVPAMLNSGELVLNQAQQGALASRLNDQQTRAVSAQSYVSGENIFLGLNNYLTRSGKGELVTSKIKLW